MQAIRIYIVEDEIITQESLRECLEQFGYEVCGLASDAMTALKEINELKPDLAFVDINIHGEQNGIWLGERLHIPFIYLTAYNDAQTIDSAVQTKPSSYLIKPFEQAQVFAAVSLVIKTYSASDDNDKEEFNIQNHYNVKGQLVIKDGHTHYKINLRDILFIRTEGKYIYLHTSERKFILRSSLSRFLEDYSNEFFERVHKSYAINLDKINAYSAGVISVGKDEIPLSRSYKSSFFERMSMFKSA